MAAYYNEIDPFAAAWLRELIKKNLIAQGEVDERSIEDVCPEDLRGFTQCHFFAGIGVWSYALRKAGWADDRPVWTGSCPCQPFSAAGKGKGFTDERHLWPSFFHLIKECSPVTIFGEQVASKDGRAWLDLVSSDVEGVGYTIGAIDTCAAGFGAPYIRQRLYWVATNGLEKSHSQRWRGRSDRPYQGNCESDCQGDIAEIEVARPSAPYELDDTTSHRLVGERSGRTPQEGREQEPKPHGQLPYGFERPSFESGLADTLCEQDRQEQQRPTTDERKGAPELFGGCGTSYHRHPGPTNGFWRGTDWLFCRDGKWRSTQSLSEPLADGLADSLGYSRIEGRYSLNPLQEKAENRVMRLKGYGNAIVAPQATEFIKAYMEIEEG